MRKILISTAIGILLLPAATASSQTRTGARLPNLILRPPLLAPAVRPERPAAAARLRFGPGAGPFLVGPGLAGDPLASFEQRAGSAAETGLLGLAGFLRAAPGWASGEAANRWGLKSAGRPCPLTGVGPYLAPAFGAFPLSFTLRY